MHNSEDLKFYQKMKEMAEERIKILSEPKYRNLQGDEFCDQMIKEYKEYISKIEEMKKDSAE